MSAGSSPLPASPWRSLFRVWTEWYEGVEGSWDVGLWWLQCGEDESVGFAINGVVDFELWNFGVALVMEAVEGEDMESAAIWLLWRQRRPAVESAVC